MSNNQLTEVLDFPCKRTYSCKIFCPPVQVSTLCISCKFSRCAILLFKRNTLLTVSLFVWQIDDPKRKHREETQKCDAHNQRKRLDYLQSYDGEQVEARQLKQTKCWKVSNRLSEWLMTTSWTNCSNCNDLAQQNARSRYACACQLTTIKVLQVDQLPHPLPDLTSEDQQLLAFFHLQQSPIRQANHGYRIKTFS